MVQGIHHCVSLPQNIEGDLNQRQKDFGIEIEESEKKEIEESGGENENG